MSAGTDCTLDCHAGSTLSSCSVLRLLWATGTLNGLGMQVSMLEELRQLCCRRGCLRRSLTKAAEGGYQRSQPKKRLPGKATEADIEGGSSIRSRWSDKVVAHKVAAVGSSRVCQCTRAACSRIAKQNRTARIHSPGQEAEHFVVYFQQTYTSPAQQQFWQ